MTDCHILATPDGVRRKHRERDKWKTIHFQHLCFSNGGILLLQPQETETHETGNFIMGAGKGEIQRDSATGRIRHPEGFFSQVGGAKCIILIHTQTRARDS